MRAPERSSRSPTIPLGFHQSESMARPRNDRASPCGRGGPCRYRFYPPAWRAQGQTGCAVRSPIGGVGGIFPPLARLRALGPRILLGFDERPVPLPELARLRLG